MANESESTTPSDPSSAPLERIARGLRGRTFKTLRLASKLGLGAAKRTFGRRKSAAADDDIDQAELQRAVRGAEDLVRTLGDLKGLAMKIGQMASYLPGALPEEAQRVLEKLQANTRAMSYETLAEVVEQELGARPEQVFERFEHEPFAAASIGQVHRARFRGRDLAVKVQYPGVLDALRSDLKTFKLFSRLTSVGTAVDGKVVAAELRDRMLEECDYALEAARQRLFAELVAGADDCLVPEVIAERSARRVLSSAFVAGRSFAEFRQQASQAEKDRAAATIFRVSMQCIFEHCVYNADPHPGNYLFDSDGRVVLLDFGCVRAFDPQMIDAWKRVALATLADDKAAWRRAFPAMGMVGNPKRFDWDHHWEVMRYIYRPFMTPGFKYTDEYVRESYDLIVFRSPNRRYIACPPEWVFLNRLQWGLNAILAKLEARGPWDELWRAAVESPTRPVDADPARMSAADASTAAAAAAIVA